MLFFAMISNHLSHCDFQLLLVMGSSPRISLFATLLERQIIKQLPYVQDRISQSFTDVVLKVIKILSMCILHDNSIESVIYMVPSTSFSATQLSFSRAVTSTQGTRPTRLIQSPHRAGPIQTRTPASLSMTVRSPQLLT